VIEPGSIILEGELVLAMIFGRRGSLKPWLNGGMKYVFLSMRFCLFVLVYCLVGYEHAGISLEYFITGSTDTS
jgi:hypothetical protein